MHFCKKLFPQRLPEGLLYAKYVLAQEQGKKKKTTRACAQGIYTLVGNPIINSDYDNNDVNRKTSLFSFLL